MRHTVLKKKDYVIEFEYITDENSGQEFIMGHIDIPKWNKKVKKDVIRDVYFLAKMQELPLCVSRDPNNIKDVKFVLMLGFVPAPYEIEDDTEQLFIWSET